MCWTSCGRVYSSIPGYKVKEEQIWEAHPEHDGQKVILGQFADRWDAEQACTRHHLEMKASGTNKNMYWNRQNGIVTSRHGYQLTWKKQWFSSRLERDGKTVSIGEFATAKKGEDTCERHHLGQLGVSDEEIDALFAERHMRAEEASRKHRRAIARTAAETRGRRRDKKIDTIALEVSVFVQGNVGPRDNCACCGKALTTSSPLSWGSDRNAGRVFCK